MIISRDGMIAQRIKEHAVLMGELEVVLLESMRHHDPHNRFFSYKPNFRPLDYALQEYSIYRKGMIPVPHPLFGSKVADINCMYGTDASTTMVNIIVLDNKFYNANLNNFWQFSEEHADRLTINVHRNAANGTHETYGKYAPPRDLNSP